MKKAMILSMVLLYLGFSNVAQSGGIEIYLVKENANSLARKLHKLTPYNGRKFISSKVRRRAVRRIPSNERKHTVVYMVKKKLAKGTRVVTQHQFARPKNGRLVKLRPYRFKYVVGATNSVNPLVILNTSKAGGSGGKLYYSVLINGRKMKEISVVIGK